MKKRRIKTRLFIPVFALLVSAFCASCGLTNSPVGEKLASLQKESGKEVAFAESYYFYYGGEAMSLYQVMNDHKEEYQSIVRIAVVDDKIWFIYTELLPLENERKRTKWDLASYDLITKELSTHTSFLSSRDIEEYGPELRYDKAFAYYFDGNIVMTDHETLVEYDTVSGQCTESDYKSYEFPESELEQNNHDSLMRTEGEQIVLISNLKDETFRLFDSEAGIRSSKAFRELMDLSTVPGRDSASVFKGAYLDMANGTYYIVLWLIDSLSQQYAVAFEYDYETNTCKYAGHCRHDNINYVRLIPVVRDGRQKLQ